MKYVWRALVAGLALWGASGVALAQSSHSDGGTLLQIEAEGTVQASPDVMTVVASVVTTGATAAEALDQNNGLAGKLIEAVRASGIRIAHMQTSGLDVDARFAEDRDNEEDSPPQILGYVARNMLEVELAEVAQAGELISLMFEAGGNEIRGPYFSLRDPTPVQRRAEQAAIQQAREEAENYAAALGMRVSRVLRVFDRNFRADDDGAIIVTGSRIRPTPIEPGEITYTATVHVEFLLEPS